MKVLFTPLAWSTHYHQLVGLAWALQAAGHTVRAAAQPPVLDAVTATGVISAAVGGEYDVVQGMSELVNDTNPDARRLNAEGPGGFDAERLSELLERRMAPHIGAALDMADDLVAFARAWRPDLVVSDPLVYAAPLAAETAGAPLVRHLWGPDFLRYYAMPGTGVDERDDPRAAWPGPLVALYDKHGVEPGADLAVRTVDTCPDSLQVPGVPNRIAVRYTSHNGAAVIPEWTLSRPDRPRICVLWGSSSTRFLGDRAFKVPLILEALRDLDLDVVVAVRAADRGRLAEVPDGVRVVTELPVDLILPTCQGIVHQSGAGTMLAAAYYGVPQVVLPQVADQFFAGDRLRRTGAGFSLTGERADADGVRAAVSALVSTAEPAAAARRLRAEMLEQPAPAEIVSDLESLV